MLNVVFVRRFQAIECFLANVKSTNVNDSESWSPDAISRFEEITHGLYNVFLFVSIGFS